MRVNRIFRWHNFVALLLSSSDSTEGIIQGGKNTESKTKLEINGLI
jgi:hypothetical protein